MAPAPREIVSLETVLNSLRAVGEPTRLRIVAVLERSELTVSELCQVLLQTQPRVSRHLRLLVDAGVLTRHPEGTSVFYRLNSAGTGRDLVQTALQQVDPNDVELERDRQRHTRVKSERAALANKYFESIAADWEELRGLHVADDAVEAALLDAVADLDIDTLVDVGTGTGRILEVFAQRIRRGLGLDLSSKMLAVARSVLDADGLRHCEARRGDAYSIEVVDGGADVVVLHHVLHFLVDPSGAITEAARTLSPGGRLLIVDFAPHQIEQLRAEHAHRRLGFADSEVTEWCEAAGLNETSVIRFDHTPEAGEEPLAVSLWVATRPELLSINPPDARTVRIPNEVAS
jgi:ubiquinone/menaquinone biosynthesis C-methylase UbiE